MLPSLGATPPLYSIVDISGKNGSQKERRIKTGTFIVSVYIHDSMSGGNSMRAGGGN